MKNQITELNYTNYDSILQQGVVLVDFWAEWCYPCKLQHKIIGELAMEYDHLFRIVRLNVDDNKVVSTKLGVRNIPTLILFSEGKEVRRIIGMQSKENILNQIMNVLTDKKTA